MDLIDLNFLNASIQLEVPIPIGAVLRKRKESDRSGFCAPELLLVVALR